MQDVLELSAPLHVSREGHLSEDQGRAFNDGEALREWWRNGATKVFNCNDLGFLITMIDWD